MRNAFPVGPSFTSAAVKECPEKKKLRGEKVYSAYSSHLQFPRSQEVKAGITVDIFKDKSRKRINTYLLTAQLIFSTLTQAMVPPTVRWVFPHQLRTETIPYRHLHKPTSSRPSFAETFDCVK